MTMYATTPYADCTEHHGCPVHGESCEIHNLCQTTIDADTGEVRHLPALRIAGPTVPDEHSHEEHSHPAMWPWAVGVGGGVVLFEALIRWVT